MRENLRNARGFTTTELIVASLFAVIVLATLYGFYRDQLYNLLSQETKTATLEDARGGLDMMVRELRNAGSWTSGSAPAEKGVTEDPSNVDDPNNDADAVCNRVYAATENLIHVQMDLNGDGDCIDTDPRENMQFEITGPTSTCLGTYIIRRNGDCLVPNVELLPGTDFLTYYAAGSVTPLSQPISDLNAIKRVKITFAVQMQNPNPNARSASPNISTTLSSSVEFRN